MKKPRTNSLELRWRDLGVVVVMIFLLASTLVAQATSRSAPAGVAAAEPVPAHSSGRPASRRP